MGKKNSLGVSAPRTKNWILCLCLLHPVFAESISAVNKVNTESINHIFFLFSFTFNVCSLKERIDGRILRFIIEGSRIHPDPISFRCSTRSTQPSLNNCLETERRLFGADIRVSDESSGVSNEAGQTNSAKA